MTLIITEVSEFGIAMVSDRAVTQRVAFNSGNEFTRILEGIQKLQRIPYLNAGISMWGLGGIPQGGTSTDLWIMDFIESNRNVASLDEFAENLTNELTLSIGGTKECVGFHIAGYAKVNGRMLPTVYHIRNNDGTHKDYTVYNDFKKGHDYPPKEKRPGDPPFELRNGDYGPYAFFSETMKVLKPKLESITGMDVPHKSLEGRLKYLAAWVKFISDMYESSQIPRSIGTSVISLGITPGDGIASYRL